ncbi:primosomal protein N' [Campylobacter sp. US33a]|uniref:primosomal protein N' n=1 Tax=Campylobacter sp. US33a TaxID=2498120 RepID=UPI001068857F|nr:primosomal protein N' [Campylobacter sp. US33a]TEY04069.1 primosomal protein N' [Campylobacter sp. US33a]
MRYYELAIKGFYLDILTYESTEIIKPLTEVIVDLGVKKNLKAIVLRECLKPNFKTKEIKEITPNSLSLFQKELADFISYYYTCKFAFILSFFETSKPYECKKMTDLEGPNLSFNQNKALDFAKENLTSLLFADTGSGKTEIYISLIKEYLEKGQQVLLLMPEISLTPQMQKRLEKYFKDKFFLWHSKISKKKKEECLRHFCEGEILLVAGARSALFLPFRNLGLIVVDEEHDNSYKASNKPYFNARDLALFLGQKLNIKVVLGSATPSVTSFYKQKYFRLKGTFFESKKEYIFDESDEILSQKLLLELRTSLREKKQIIIFLPSRANFRQILCKDCGDAIKCPFCSIALSMHKSKNILKCHYCNFIQEIPFSCPKCKGEVLEARKMGTAELKERLEGIFIDAKIAKFDSDEITSEKKLNAILKDFNDEKIDILVGTSMLAKGHDYHSVDLSVILGLDEYLFRPNFRASEETLALAMQVAGRAGRKGEARVLLQTKNKPFFEKYIQNYDEFLKDELEIRKNLYPPFKRLMRIVIEDKEQKTALKTCEKLVFEIGKIKQVELIGYGACGIEIINNKFRFYILLRSNTYTHLVKIANYALEFKNVSCDIDPIDFS